MLNVSEMIEKLSMDDINKLVVNKNERQIGDREKKERELIERVQKYNDGFAMEELIREYRGTLNKLLMNSKLGSAIGSEDSAYQMLLNEFEDAIKNKYDLKNDKAAPNTFITKRLGHRLQNLTNDNRGGAIYMPEELNRHKGTVDSAISFLKLEGNDTPTDKEVCSYVKNNMGLGKDLTEKKVKTIRANRFTEWSGQKQFGGSGKNGNAESITYEDVYNTSKETPAEITKRKDNIRIVKAEIENFTQKNNERRFFYQYLRVPPYDNTPKRPSLRSVSINNVITYYKGEQLLEDFKKYLAQKGIV